MAQTDFEFGRFADLAGDGIVVRVSKRIPANPTKRYVPSYACEVLRTSDHAVVGTIVLRIGNDEWLQMFAGQLGYAIDPAYQGHRYAARACEALKPIALHHGLDPLWITVEPDNVPSRRTCEILGCALVEVVDLPPECDMYREGQRQKCRYRWNLGTAASRT